MSASFHFDAGPFSIAVQLDDAGILFGRKTLGREQTESVPWNRITEATLVPPASSDAGSDQTEERMAELFGPEALAKYRELHGKVAQVFVAYRDDKNRKQQMEVPAPMSDPAFLQEFQARLGSRWLGESRDRQQAERRLDTNPGFFKTVFVLVALLGMVAVVAAIGLLGFLGPVMNFLSIQKMLLDLQDGNYVSLGYRFATYVLLFILGLFLHRIIRSKLDALKRPRPQHSASPR